MSERLTVGAAATALLSNSSPQGVIDTQREMQKGYVDQLIMAAKRYSWTEPFYICVQTRRERLLTNVIRCQFYGRQTRPRPEYDLALYWYDPKSEELRFVWCIPDKQTVEELVAPGAMVPPEHRQLQEFCTGFVNGTLY